MPFLIKRIYDEVDPRDGFRVLVDRLWPRGVSKEEAHIDLWLKEVAPSTELRTWFDHRADRFTEFSDRYAAELDSNPAVATLRQLGQAHPTVTLLYSAKNPQINQAVVLAEYLAADDHETPGGN
ncbi:DUF488 domain-containing protein [Acrocarpospora macrocephala]|uniref:MarR family transcriptional regulator n=1 Tax=Acrocarpospora macrocephala TaxID=150177 RepID=A0A5M3WLF1_9ACTN|nr:DUF488 family protein [Acrocarpospora macrocephala]GES07118.1 hypothetical protein Amac_007130 [Acrocarpospora macrocephala]